MNKIGNIFLFFAIPLAVVFGIAHFGASWYVPWLMLLLTPYWYGPFLTYFGHRLPCDNSSCTFDSGTTIPPEHKLYFEKTVQILQTFGFVQVQGLVVNVNEKQSSRGTASLMQHQETSDLAHLLIVTAEDKTGLTPKNTAEVLGFSRLRTDGSEICTSWSTLASPFPQGSIDSILRLEGCIAPLDLWRIHQARVAEDANATKYITITNAFDYHKEMEKENVRKHIASGYFQKSKRPNVLRPTLKGALLMCFRMLPPWVQIARIRARLQARRYLQKIQGSCFST
jgi:hypothetical protein